MVRQVFSFQKCISDCVILDLAGGLRIGVLCVCVCVCDGWVAGGQRCAVGSMMLVEAPEGARGGGKGSVCVCVCVCWKAP